MTRAERWSLVTACLFLLPAVALLLVFDYLPTLRSLQLMFYEWNLVRDDPHYVGLDNFSTVFNDPRFHKALKARAELMIGR